MEHKNNYKNGLHKHLQRQKMGLHRTHKMGTKRKINVNGHIENSEMKTLILIIVCFLAGWGTANDVNQRNNGNK